MWARKSGVAVITNAYIANGPHQMTVIPGDSIRVIESTGAWHRGKNMYTGRTGIFPAACARFIETENATSEVFTTDLSDLIFYETSVTLETALDTFLHARGSQECLKLADRIFDVITQVDLCRKAEVGQGSRAARATLASSLDNLRLALNLPKNSRNLCSNVTTVSTWGREELALKEVDTARVVKKNEYVLLNASVEVRTLKKEMVCRFFLYDPSTKKFLSCPVSLATVEGLKYELLFDQLETRHIQRRPGEDDSLYLCIYTFDLMNHREGQHDERKFVSCAVARLPKAKNASGKYFGKCRMIEAQSMSGPKSVALEMHKILCGKEKISPELQKKITRAGPTFQIKFTPFFGATEDIVKGQNLKAVQIIPPLSLPLQIPLGMKRNMLTVTVGNINIDSHPKKIRMIVRILDTANCCFLKGMEGILLLSYENTTWCGPLISGKRPSPNEVFGIDLNVTNAPLCSLFLVIQIDKVGMAEKKLSPYAYAMIRLSSDIGSLTRDLEKTIDLLDFKPAGKVVAPSDFPLIPKGTKKKVGTLDYRFDPATTVVTQDENLHTLLYSASQSTINIKGTLEQLMFCGITEWSKFAPRLMMSICNIMVKMDEHAQLAFTTLQSMFAELLSKAGSDYSPLMGEFIKLQFDSDDPLVLETAKGLCNKMLSVILDILALPITDQNYRTCLKTMTYHVHLIGRSYSKDPTSEKRENIGQLFRKFSEIIGHGEEPDKVLNSFLLTNQRLLMDHFAAMVDELPRIFGAVGACNIARQFITSIRTDNDQINKAKMQMLLELVQKSALWTKETQVEMRNLYTGQINWAFEKAGSQPTSCPLQRDDSSSSVVAKGQSIDEYIARILASLFFAYNDDYIIAFVSKVCSQGVNIDLSRLLLICSFLFPSQFPFKELMDLMQMPFLSAFELLFVLMHVVTEAKNEVESELMKEPDVTLFKCALDLAFKSGSRLEDRVDCRLHEYIYSINNNFTILLELYRVLPLEKRVDYNIANQILSVYTCFQSPTLVEWFYEIVKSDIELNQDCSKGKYAILNGLWCISSVPNFRILETFFANESTEDLTEFSTKYAGAVASIATVQELEPSRRNEDERAEALIYLLNLSREAKDQTLELVYLKMLVQLNRICQNSLEAAFTLKEILPLIKCDDEPLEEPFLQFKATCGRELHTEILFEIASLCISSGYEELAIPFCDRIIETCVKQFGHIELMPKVMALKEQIYRNIATTTRTFSSFFRATFYGKGFSKCYRDRTFVYRRVVTAGGTGTFKDEMRHKFSQETVLGTEPPSDEEIAGENSRYIQLGSVVPSTEEEAADPFFRPPYQAQPRYISEFQEHNRSALFRADIVSYESGATNDAGIPKASNVVVHQQFLRVTNTFPYFACRVEVDTTKTTDCLLKPLDNATVAIARKNQQIISDFQWVAHRLDQYRRPDACTISRLSSSINSAIQAGTVGNTKAYVEAFLPAEFLQAHADQAKNIERLKEVLIEQLVYILKSTKALKDVETRETKETNANTAKNFIGMVKLMREFGVVIDQKLL